MVSLPATDPLAVGNTLALESHCLALCEICTDAELLKALSDARRENMATLILGEGSNVVLAQSLQYRVLLQRSKGIEVLSEGHESVVLRVAAGENWHSFVVWSLERGYYGLENLALIPGTVGASPIQNIGAYGVELEQYVEAVHGRLIDSAQLTSLTNEECQFSYRDSIFKHKLRNKMVITQVDFKLSKKANLSIEYPALLSALEDRPTGTLTPLDVFNAVVQIRQSKLPDPAVTPNVGSFFKNPVVCADKAQLLKSSYPTLALYPQSDGTVKVAAAWLIDFCGWKGFQENGVGVHPEHALVLVNHEAVNASVLLTLAEKITASVKDQFAIELEIEPRMYGFSND